MDQEQLRTFFADKLDIGHLPKEEQEQVIGQFSELILERVTVAALERIPEEKRDAFNALTEKNDAVLVQEFLKEHVPDLEQIMQQTVAAELKAFEDFQKDLA